MNRKKTKEYVNDILSSENRMVVLHSQYTGMKDHTDFKCLKCQNVWIARPDSIIKGHGCPKCEYDSRRLTNEIIDRKILGSDTKRNGNFIDSKTKIEWRCLRCDNTWRARTHKIFLGQGCPLCGVGRNERRVKKIIEDNFVFKSIDKISYTINGIKRVPDFTITKKDSTIVIVEYNGEQHYRPVKFSNQQTDEDVQVSFMRQKKRDAEVESYFLKKRVPIVWIKYNTPEEDVISILGDVIPRK